MKTFYALLSLTFAAVPAWTGQIRVSEFQFNRPFDRGDFCRQPAKWVCEYSSVRELQTQTDGMANALAQQAMKQVAPDLRADERLNDYCFRKSKGGRSSAAYDSCANAMQVRYLKILDVLIQQRLGLSGKKRVELVALTRKVLPYAIDAQRSWSTATKTEMKRKSAEGRTQVFYEYVRQHPESSDLQSCGYDGLSTHAFISSEEPHALVMCPGFWIKYGVEMGSAQAWTMGVDILGAKVAGWTDAREFPESWQSFSACVAKRYPLQGADGAHEFDGYLLKKRAAEFSADYLAASAWGLGSVEMKTDPASLAKTVATRLSVHCDAEDAAPRIEFFIKGNRDMRKALGCEAEPYESCDTRGRRIFTGTGDGAAEENAAVPTAAHSAD